MQFGATGAAEPAHLAHSASFLDGCHQLLQGPGSWQLLDAQKPRLAAQAMRSQGIAHAVQLEQWLMEGAYNKVLEARPQLPHPAYTYFMEKLLSTVRCARCAHRTADIAGRHPWQMSELMLPWLLAQQYSCTAASTCAGPSSCRGAL